MTYHRDIIGDADLTQQMRDGLNRIFANAQLIVDGAHGQHAPWLNIAAAALAVSGGLPLAKEDA